MDTTSLLVVGAGPYGVSVAAQAQKLGIDTVVAGRSMGFWAEQMPADMFLRSGPGWHLDASGVHTFRAYLEEQALDPADVDPVPIAVFLGYAEWFRRRAKVAVREPFVSTLEPDATGWLATFADGSSLHAERVVATPGVGHFQELPAWAADLPAGVATHTCDLPRFDDVDGARVLVVGGRQSAYEWAALLADHGAERVDVVHRHDVPVFGRVSWDFVEPYLEATLTTPGWWRSLAAARRDAITQEFWRAGRLTLEWWLVPRLPTARVRRRPGTQVVRATVGAPGTTVTLSDGTRLDVDRIVFATGYRTDLARVPYLAPLVPRLDVAGGFPVLDEAFQTSLPGLYLPGFTATRDFGPFFGFTRGCPTAARIVVDDLLRAA